MTKDMTTGSPVRLIIGFAVPMFLGMLFQQFYSMVDTVIVGQYLGVNPLAGVGSTTSLNFMVIGFCMGVCNGFAIPVAQMFGAREESRLRRFVTNGAWLCIGFSVFLTILVAAVCGPVLRMMNTPEEIFADSELYLDIYIWGLPFLFFYNISTGIFSALGDSKTPFIFLALSSLANIGVDILFVSTFHMGVAGVAWATFLCQGVSCLLSLWVVARKLRGIETKGDITKFSFSMLKKLSAIAVPSILQQSFVSVGNIMIQGVVNSFGPGVIAGYSAAVKLNNLVITSFSTLGNGISNFTAQNIGAGMLPRIREGFKAGIKMVWLLCLPLVVLYLVAGGWLVGLFMNEPSGSALSAGMQFLRIVSPFYFLISVKLAADGILRGAGMMKMFMAGTFSDLILRVVLSRVFSGWLGVTGIWCAWPVGWAIGMLLSVAFYAKGPWMEKRGREKQP